MSSKSTDIHPTKQSQNVYIKSMDLLYLVGMWISGTSLLLMVAVIPIGIFARYILNSGYSWPEPVSIICMTTFTFIGAAVSYRAASHIAVTMVTDRLPKKMALFFDYTSQSIMIIISLFILYYGSSLVFQVWDQPTAEFPLITAGMKYLPLPLGSLITLFFIIEYMLFGSQKQRPIVMIGSHS